MDLIFRPCGTPFVGIPTPLISAFNIFDIIHIRFLSCIPILHICFNNFEWSTLSINPCISSEWQEYEIRYKFGESIYNIKVQNPNRKCTGVEKFLLNGVEIPEKKIRILDNGKVNEIHIIM